MARGVKSDTLSMAKSGVSILVDLQVRQDDGAASVSPPDDSAWRDPSVAVAATETGSQGRAIYVRGMSPTPKKGSTIHIPLGSGPPPL